LCQFPIALHCTLIRSLLLFTHHPPPQSHLVQLKAIAKGFIILFHVCILKPTNHLPSPSSLSFTLPLAQAPTLHLFYSHVLRLLIKEEIFIFAGYEKRLREKFKYLSIKNWLILIYSILWEQFFYLTTITLDLRGHLAFPFITHSPPCSIPPLLLPL
jgi:hypothetical protein